MEYVPGKDLDELVRKNGSLPPDQACGLIYQVASALAEAHRHDLVHRDIKPSNIRVTPDGQAKLLVFGLVCHFQNRITEPGCLLGTLDYLAPEQARDASSVDIRADVFGLGGTLFFCLTGKAPFLGEGSLAEKFAQRMTQAPPSVRTWNSKISRELDAVVALMMAFDPQKRYATPQAVMNALLPFLKTEPPLSPRYPTFPEDSKDTAHRLHRVLVVFDHATIRHLCSSTLLEAGIPCDEVSDGNTALAAVISQSYDLVLADWMMPGTTGIELCRKLRENPPYPNLKIILFATEVTDDGAAQMLEAGADDYLDKHFSPLHLIARVKTALRLKASQDRADLLNHQILQCNRQLEQTLMARDIDQVEIRNALVLALADLISFRDTETISHLMRLQRYCRYLGAEAALLPTFAGQIDGSFIQMLECCAPLHDIGKVGLPDNLLGKPGKLDAEERLMMQTHTIIGRGDSTKNGRAARSRVGVYANGHRHCPLTP